MLIGGLRVSLYFHFVFFLSQLLPDVDVACCRHVSFISLNMTPLHLSYPPFLLLRSLSLFLFFPLVCLHALPRRRSLWSRIPACFIGGSY